MVLLKRGEPTIIFLFVENIISYLLCFLMFVLLNNHATNVKVQYFQVNIVIVKGKVAFISQSGSHYMHVRRAQRYQRL
jgi:hypothetical protein